VPLAHNDPKCTETIELHAEFVYKHDEAIQDAKKLPNGELSANDLVDALGSLTSALGPESQPTLTVYLCGGPGSDNPSFEYKELTKTLLTKMNTPVLYLNYRGTGSEKSGTKSSEHRVTATSLKRLEPEEAASRLMLYLQDSIAADFEAVRLCLSQLCNKNIRFALVGQSYGGWIAMTYLSFLPESLAGVWLTGGMPPIGKTPDEVYTALYKQVVEINKKYYDTYPKDVGRVWTIVQDLAKEDKGQGIQLSGGGRLTARGFLTMGRHLGGGKAGFEKFHRHVVGLAEEGRNYQGLNDVDITGFRLSERPLYAVLHEAIYCGPGVKSEWAAQRVGITVCKNYAWLDGKFDFSAGPTPGLQKLYFSGEMIFDFMLPDAGQNEFDAVSKVLAQRNDWPAVYDLKVLKENRVPLTALIYPDDMFVDFGLSRETAKKTLGSCKAIKAPLGWAHGYIKTNPGEVCDVLFDGKLAEHSAEVL
jgi:pimeloyl-ACP methyl ester carboxylesterase